MINKIILLLGYLGISRGFHSNQPVNSKMSWRRQVFANYHIIFYIIINIGKNITFYYINTNEIPGELSSGNFRYLHMWKYHRCHGFIINRAFHTKKLFKSNGFVFHWCLCNKTLHGRLEIRNFSSCVEKNFHSFAALTHDIFFNTRREILRVAM